MTFRRRAAFLMALILALHGMLHAWCAPAPGGGTSGLLAICTAHGVAWVPREAPDAPAKPKQDSQACQAGHCGGNLLPPSAADAPNPTFAASPPRRPGDRDGAWASRLQLPPARSPPPIG